MIRFKKIGTRAFSRSVFAAAAMNAPFRQLPECQYSCGAKRSNLQLGFIVILGYRQLRPQSHTGAPEVPTALTPSPTVGRPAGRSRGFSGRCGKSNTGRRSRVWLRLLSRSTPWCPDNGMRPASEGGCGDRQETIRSARERGRSSGSARVCHYVPKYTQRISKFYLPC